tara:strand:+ start:1779 stop:1925 length:147 start_codon:yes stop_codon:yes gene_type:complete
MGKRLFPWAQVRRPAKPAAAPKKAAPKAKGAAKKAAPKAKGAAKGAKS